MRLHQTQFSRKTGLVVTLDYEIFGNGSGCVGPCLRGPTAALMEELESFDYRLTIFVDCTELRRMEEVDGRQSSELSVLRDQLQNALLRGHRLELHTHPQWERAHRDHHGTWVVDLDAWRIGDLTRERVHRILSSDHEWLVQLCTEVDSDYRPVAYRAGGWCIQPSGVVLPELHKLGYRVDSTVAPGAFELSSGLQYDFREAPRAPMWPIEHDVLLETPGGHLREIPICTSRKLMLRRLCGRFAGYLRPDYGLPLGCHGTYDGPASSHEGSTPLLSKIRSKRWGMLDLSTNSATANIAIANDWLQRHAPCDTPVVAISHAKNFTTLSRMNLRRFLRFARAHGALPSTSFVDWLDPVSGQPPKEAHVVQSSGS